VSIDEEQRGRAVDIANRRKGAEEGRAVAPGDEGEATGVEHRLYAGVDSLDHLQQWSLVHEAGQMASCRIGLGQDDVGGETCAGEIRGQPGVP
jgi:hypothetical protein